MAKKAAAKKTSPKPAAKKTGGKKASAKKASPITEQDLAQVYAKAWTDEAFRTLLETDPTAALKQYAAENGLQWTTLAVLPAAPAPADAGQDENCIHLVSCC